MPPRGGIFCCNLSTKALQFVQEFFTIFTKNLLYCSCNPDVMEKADAMEDFVDNPTAAS